MRLKIEVMFSNTCEQSGLCLAFRGTTQFCDMPITKILLFQVLISVVKQWIKSWVLEHQGLLLPA